MLTLLRQVDLTRQIGARKPVHHDSPFNLRRLDIMTSGRVG
jgi:hypothetical protein